MDPILPEDWELLEVRALPTVTGQMRRMAALGYTVRESRRILGTAYTPPAGAVDWVGNRRRSLWAQARLQYRSRKPDPYHPALNPRGTEYVAKIVIKLVTEGRLGDCADGE